MQTRQELSWDEVHAACLELREEIQRPVSTVVAVARGGLVPASILAYALDLQVAMTVTMSNVDFVRSARHDILVVDDIADTGATFTALRDMFPNACFVAPYAKPRGFAVCDHYVVPVPQDAWVVMPWAPYDEVNR